MKKFSIICLIFILILFTAYIKNSTKRINDEIFLAQENIRDLKKEFENIKLEYDYLSSAEKLLEYQVMYFDDELVKKDIQNITIINENINNINIEQFKLTDQ